MVGKVPRDVRLDLMALGLVAQGVVSPFSAGVHELFDGCLHFGAAPGKPYSSR